MNLLKKKKHDVVESKPEDDFEEVNIFKEILGMVIYIIVIIILIYLIITFVGQRTEVIGDSMNNTLENGENLWIDKLTYRFKDPERFDIIVFPYQDSKTYYIKRIIGLPGETVYISDEGYIYVNNQLLEEDYGKEQIKFGNNGLASTPITLGPDEYFVLGDNRNNSQDSRREAVGNIQKDEIIGKAVFRMWPFNKIGFVNK